MPDDLEKLRAWVGRKETRNDVLTSWPVEALAATVGDGDVSAARGSPVPPGWHWIYFLEAKPAAELGIDGHAKLGGFLPPVPLPRRMWAGGRIEFLKPLAIGDDASRESEILSVEPKTGRSGALVFVTVRHTISGAEGAAIVEEHDIVYREAARKGDPLPAGKPAPAGAQWSRRAMPDAVMLFRYSALTFNGHRIHYDNDFAVSHEHYPGIVVHGPLQATMLLDLCRRNAPAPIRKFEYRAEYPLFGGSAFTVNGNFDASSSVAALWTASEAGYYAMRATGSFQALA